MSTARTANLAVPFLGSVATVALWLLLANYRSLFGLPAVHLSIGWSWGGGAVFLLDGIITLFWSISTLTVAQANGTLALTGPYAYLRHPIYGALLYSGTAAAAFFFSSWPVLLAVFPLSILWTLIAEGEEAQLIGLYGDDYRTYMQQTGQLFPSLKKIIQASHAGPDNPAKP